MTEIENDPEGLSCSLLASSLPMPTVLLQCQLLYCEFGSVAGPTGLCQVGNVEVRPYHHTGKQNHGGEMVMRVWTIWEEVKRRRGYTAQNVVIIDGG